MSNKAFAKPFPKIFGKAFGRMSGDAGYGGAVGGGLPAIAKAELVQWFKGDKVNVDGMGYMVDSVGTTRAPVQMGQSFMFDGAAYLEHADIIAGDTVENEGTATLSIVSGRINGTAGTAWNITVKKVNTDVRLWIPGADAVGTSIPCLNEGVPDTITLVGGTPASFYHKHVDGYGFDLNKLGFSQRENLFLNSIFAGAVSGTPGTEPTSWDETLDGGTLTAGSETLGVSVSTARHFFNQSVTVSDGETYYAGVSLVTDSVLLLGQYFRVNTSPSGTTITYYLNGSEAQLTDSVPVGSNTIRIKSVVTTAGDINYRMGVGIGGNMTGSAVFSQPYVTTDITEGYTKTTSDPIQGIQPADPSGNGLDITGNTLQHPGPIRLNAPLTGHTGNWDGVAYMDCPHLTGSETITDIDPSATATPSISAGRIDFTIGACAYLILSDGTHYVIESEPTSDQGTIWDVVGGNHAQLQSHTTPFFTTPSPHATYLLEKGWTEGQDAIVGYVPASAVNDNESALGQPLTYGPTDLKSMFPGLLYQQQAQALLNMDIIAQTPNLPIYYYFNAGGDALPIAWDGIASDLGANVIVNGTFDDTSGWTIINNWTITGGVAVCTPSPSTNHLSQLSIEAGKMYWLYYEIVEINVGYVTPRFGTVLGPNENSVGPHSAVVTSDGTDFRFITPNSGDLTIDNVEVREVLISGLPINDQYFIKVDEVDSTIIEILNYSKPQTGDALAAILEYCNIT